METTNIRESLSQFILTADDALLQAIYVLFKPHMEETANRSSSSEAGIRPQSEWEEIMSKQTIEHEPELDDWNVTNADGLEDEEDFDIVTKK